MSHTYYTHNQENIFLKSTSKICSLFISRNVIKLSEFPKAPYKERAMLGWLHRISRNLKLQILGCHCKEDLGNRGWGRGLGTTVKPKIYAGQNYIGTTHFQRAFLTYILAILLKYWNSHALRITPRKLILKSPQGMNSIQKTFKGYLPQSFIVVDSENLNSSGAYRHGLLKDDKCRTEVSQSCQIGMNILLMWDYELI